MRKLLVFVTLFIIIFASCINITPSSPDAGTTDGDLPVIKSFSANPGSIGTGDSSTLSWEVTGASSVSIDQEIGNVALSGTQAVTPDATTRYTLTAVGAGGRVTASTEIIVSTAAAEEPPPPPAEEPPPPPPEEAPPPAPAEPPVVVAFEVSPTGIDSGDSATLLWNVTGADSISIDNGIGDVAPAGTETISPTTTTTYTITAINSAGTSTETAELAVALIFIPFIPLQIIIPDLAVTSIQKIAGPDSYLIRYTVKNEGTANVPTTKARLYANGAPKASDTIPELEPDESVTRTFTGWKYDPTTPQIKVVADVTDIVSEFNEDNNTKIVNYGVQVWVNYVDKAPQASWGSGAGSLSFGGSTSDNEGFATYRNNIVLEDGHTYSKVLETHPQWVNDGYIYGWYPSMTIPFATKFSAKVGFIKGASGTDGVTYRVLFWEQGKLFPSTLGTVNATYNSKLDTINISLFDKAGKKGRIGLSVSAGGSSSKDWAIWSSAKMIR